MNSIPELARIRMLIDSLPGRAVVVWMKTDVGGEMVVEATEMANLETVGLLEVAKLAIIRDGVA